MAAFAGAISELAELEGGRRRLAEVARMTWLWRGASQACLSCLIAEPEIWLLEWRLPWVFDCDRHNRLLTTHCPCCDRLLTERHVCLTDIPTALLAECRPGDLTGVRQADHHTGRRIRKALAGSDVSVSIGAVPPGQYLDSLRALSGLIEHMERSTADAATSTRRAVAAAPREPETRARLLSTADRLLSLSPDDAARELMPLLDRVSITGTGVATWLRDHSRPTDLVLPITDRLADSRRTIGRLRLPKRSDVNTAHVPQLIWPKTWVELRPLIASSESTGRCFASMALVKMTTGHTWAAVGQMLGLPPQLARNVSRKGKDDLVDEPSFMRVLGTVIPPSDVDWRQRERQAFALIGNESTLADIADAVGASHVEHCFMRERIWQQWADGHPLVLRATLPSSKSQRARAANQRRRWRPEQSVRLTVWLRNRFQSYAPGAR